MQKRGHVGVSNQREESKVVFLTDVNLVKAMLQEGRTIERVYIDSQKKKQMAPIARLCKERGVPFDWKPLPFLWKKGIRTGMGAQVSEVRTCSEETLFSLIKAQSVLIVLDGVTNVGNVASILRTAYFLGVTAVVMRKRRSAQLNERVVQLSRGAALSVPIARVGSLYPFLRTLKEKGVQILAFSPRGVSLSAFQPTFPCALLLGDEHKGVSRTLLSLADASLSIPMRHRGSLNVAVSCGIALFWLWQK